MSSILIDQLPILELSSNEMKGSSLKWLQALENQSFEEFNKFQDMSKDHEFEQKEESKEPANSRSRQVIDAYTAHDQELRLSVEAMAVRLSLSSSVAYEQKSNVVEVKQAAKAGQISVQIKSVDLNGSKIKTIRPVLVKAIQSQIPEEFVKVIESPSGVTVLVRNYFKSSDLELVNWANKLKEIVKEQTGEAPKVLVNGEHLDSIKEKQ